MIIKVRDEGHGLYLNRKYSSVKNKWCREVRWGQIYIQLEIYGRG